MSPDDAQRGVPRVAVLAVRDRDERRRPRRGRRRRRPRCARRAGAPARPA